MALTRTITLRLIRIVGVIIIIALIVAYAIWRSLNYERGPQIQVFEPLNGASIASSTVLVRGRSLRVNDLLLDGAPISVDQVGNFTETVIVFPGLNRLTLTAHDQFGRHTQTEVDVVGPTP